MARACSRPFARPSERCIVGCVIALVIRRAWWLAVCVLLPANAGADDRRSAVVWYRGAEGCPSSTEFLASLGGKARMAQAGDHIDFVVTLIATPSGTSGRLERQTEAGTVAIAEVEDPECRNVADAIVLTLSLAVHPPGAPSGITSTPTPRDRPGPASSPGPLSESHPGSPPRTAETEPAAGSSRPSEPVPPAPSRPRWLLVAQGGISTVLTPEIAAAGAVLLDFEPAAGAASGSYRIGALGLASSPEDPTVGRVDHWVAAARLAGCPVAIGRDPVTLMPCAVLDIGATGARAARATGLSASGQWLAVGGVARVRSWVSRGLAVEAELGAVVPLTRYETTSGDRTLYRTGSMGGWFTIGPAVRIY